MNSHSDDSDDSLVLSNIPDEVVEMIARIETLADATPTLLTSIRAWTERPVSLPTFEVTLAQFKTLYQQLQDFGLRGIEYDGRIRRLVVRPYPNPLTKAVRDSIIYWFDLAVEQVRELGDGDWVWSNEKSYDLSEPFAGTSKEANIYLSHLSAPFPLMVLCIAHKESRLEILDDAKHWLYGTENHTKVVIAVEVSERDPPDPADLWISSMDLTTFKDAEDISKEIIHVDDLQGPIIVGAMTFTFWVLTRDNCAMDASVLPGPAYIYKCNERDIPSEGNITGDFLGSEHVHRNFHIKINGTFAPLNFDLIEDVLRLGVMKYRNDRALAIAVDLWEEYFGTESDGEEDDDDDEEEEEENEGQEDEKQEDKKEDDDDDQLF